MQVKFIFLILAILLNVQVYLYNWWIYQGTKSIDEEIARLEVDYRKLDEQRASLGSITKQLKANLARIPATVLVEYNDPEREFTAFLDYLSSPELEKLQMQVKMGQEMQKYNSSPIQFYQSDFDLEGKFFSVYDAEKALKYLLVDNKYALYVRELSFKRGDITQIKMTASLLIPVRHKMDGKRTVQPTTSLTR